MSKVQLRGGFSDRNGIKKENIAIQLYEFDERTRSRLLNLTTKLIIEMPFGYVLSEQIARFYCAIIEDVYCEIISYDDCFDEIATVLIAETMKNGDYDDVLTLIGFFAIKFEEYFSENVTEIFNNIFEKEYVGYRFVNNEITSISDQIEIDEIEQAVKSEFEQVNEHLRKALGFLSDRNAPDYENSIKESMLAVECICCQIAEKKSYLSGALKKLKEQGLKIHGSLESAFSKLYGYTSDGKAIRHAGEIGGADSTFEEAKFMVVACSAFVNYIIGNKAKL